MDNVSNHLRLSLMADILALNSQSTHQENDNILNKLLTCVRSHLNMEVAFISEIKDGFRIFRYVDCEKNFQPITIDGFDKLKNSYCQRVLDGRLPELILNAIDHTSALELPATNNLPIGAHVSVPLVFSDESVYGTFCCFSRKPNYQLNARDLETVRFLSYCAALVLEKNVKHANDFDCRKNQINAILATLDFYPVFQPIYSLTDHKRVGFEALTRFNNFKFSSPDLWFSQAKNVGLLSQLETAAIEKSLLNFGDSEVFAKRDKSEYLSLNLSPSTLLENQNQFDYLLNSNHNVVIELTEHDVIEDYLEINSILKPLRDRGVKLAIDDVGSGYASLKHILKLKPDIIKIDREIIRSIHENRDAQLLTQSLVEFSHAMDYQVIAEGIETQEELSMLKTLNVHRGQGFFLGMPLKEIA